MAIAINNPDGYGMSYPDLAGRKNQIRLYKNAHDLYISYFRVKKDRSLPVMLHFRFATCGARTPLNTQPFALHDGNTIAHNGVIHYLSDSFANLEGKQSDSRKLVDIINRNKMPFQDYYDMLNCITGKFAILDRDGNFFWTSKHEWKYDRLDLYSNLYF